MHKYYKFFVVSIVLFLSLISLAACSNPPWESGMTLVLKVDAPKDGTTVNTGTVTVSGQVTGTESASAKVSVNDKDAPVKEGKFSTEITLTEGSNVITVAASSGQAKLNEKVTVTYSPAK